MKILAFLLAMLKIFGILLLCFILIFIVIVALIFLIPIKYNAVAEKSTRLYANLEITWLKKVVYFRYKISNRCKKVIFKAFGKVLYKDRKTFDDSSDDENELNEPNETVSTSDDTELDKSEIETNIPQSTSKTHSDRKRRKENERQIDLQLENIVEDTSQKLEEEIEKEIKEDSIIDKIKSVWNYEDRKKIVDLTLKLFKRFLKVIFPKNLKVNVEFGSDNPANTGYVLAMSSILNLYFGNTINVRGNFDRSVLNGNIQLDGKFTIGKIIIVFLRYIFKKPILKLILKYLKNRKKGNDK